MDSKANRYTCKQARQLIVINQFVHRSFYSSLFTYLS